MNRRIRNSIFHWNFVALAGIKYGINSKRYQETDRELLSHRRIGNYRRNQLEHPNKKVVESYTIPESALVPELDLPTWEDAVIVDDDYSFFDMMEKLKKTTVLALDIQSSSRLSYGDMACTMQISVHSADYIIDCLKVPFEIRNNLKVVLEDPEKIIVVHDGQRHLTWLKNQFSIFPVGAFDTAVYHQVMTGGTFVSLDKIREVYCGEPPLSEKIADTKEVLHLADWTLRPLPEEMRTYCQDGSHALIRIYNEIIKKANLVDLKRTVEEFRSEILKPYGINVVSSPNQDLKKIGEDLELLADDDVMRYRNLWYYRDILAKYYDRNPYSVLTTQTLLRIACKNTTDYEILQRIIYGDIAKPKMQFLPSQAYKNIANIITYGELALQNIVHTICHGCCERGHPGWACWKVEIFWEDKKQFFNMQGHRKFKSSENKRNERRKERKTEFFTNFKHANPNEVWKLPSPQEERDELPPPWVLSELSDTLDEDGLSDSGSDSTLVSWYSADSIISGAASSYGYRTAEEF